MNLGYNFKRIKVSGITVQEPVILSALLGPSGKLNVTAILDTGSDFVLLPLEMAELLGLELEKTKTEKAKTYAGEPLTTTQSTVKVQINKDREKIEFSCKCAVSLNPSAQHEYIIFGASFLQHFRILLDYPKNRFHIKS